MADQLALLPEIATENPENKSTDDAERPASDPAPGVSRIERVRENPVAVEVLEVLGAPYLPCGACPAGPGRAGGVPIGVRDARP